MPVNNKQESYFHHITDTDISFWEKRPLTRNHNHRWPLLSTSFFTLTLMSGTLLCSNNLCVLFKQITSPQHEE